MFLMFFFTAHPLRLLFPALADLSPLCKLISRSCFMLLCELCLCSIIDFKWVRYSDLFKEPQKKISIDHSFLNRGTHKKKEDRLLIRESHYERLIHKRAAVKSSKITPQMNKRQHVPLICVAAHAIATRVTADSTLTFSYYHSLTHSELAALSIRSRSHRG